MDYKEAMALRYLQATPYCGKKTLLCIYAMSTRPLFMEESHPAFKRLYRFISKLRRKGHCIKNVRGKGYRLITN